MNKSFLILFGIFSCLIVINLISAVSVAYVIQNPNALNLNERVIKSLLIENEYDLTIVDDVSFNADDYDAVIVSESVSSIENIFDNGNVKTLFLSNSAAKNAGLSSEAGVSSGTFAYIANNQHMITGDFDLGNLNVYYSQTKMSYINGCKAVGGKNMAYKSDSDKSILFLVDENSLLLNGSCNKKNKKIHEKNVFFGLTEASEWNSSAKTLFLNSLDWLINYEDKDKDGFMKKDDCNDEDSSIYPYAEELIDDIDQNCVDDKPVFIGGIKDITWNVNQKIINALNLNDYFKDPEGDDLVFEIKEISFPEIYIDLNNEWVSFSSLEDWKGQGWIIFKAENGGGSVVSNKIILKVGDGISSNSNTSNENQDYKFKEIKGRKEKNENIKVYIRSPSEGRGVDLGSRLSIRVEVINDAEEDLDFDVDVYLYDLTNDEIVEDLSYTLKIDDGERITSNKEIEISEDLNEDNEYAIFAKASDGEYYNENYVKIDLKRAENKVIVDLFDINPASVNCGDYVNMRVRVYNVGQNDEEVYIRIKNSDLKINEESEKVDLEKYGENDNEKKEFRIKIPEDVENGEYILTASVFFNGRSFSQDEKLDVNCDYRKEKDSGIELDKVNNLEPIKVKTSGFNYSLLFLVWGILAFGGLIAVLLVIGYFKFRRGL